MSIAAGGGASGRHRLEWDGSVLELAVRRAGPRTEVALFRDGQPVSEGTGVARVLVPVPETAGLDEAPGHDGPAGYAPRPPTVLALGVLPGVISRCFLLVPKADPGTEAPNKNSRAAVELAGLAGAERHRFTPPPGTLAARLLAFQRTHPRLYASRHVAVAAGEVVLGLLGVALLFQLILWRAISWITQRQPRIEFPGIKLPGIPWPDVDLPSIPWPNIDWPDLPDLSLPGWLLPVVATAKYWVPILIAVGIAAEEVERRRSKRSRSSTDAARRDQSGPGTRDSGGGSHRDAHR